ncbi:unnamed protein product, partial [Staurois parvus]
MPVICIPLLMSCHADRGEESRPINATCQCPSVPTIGAAYQYHLSVPYRSAAFQCPSVMPVNALQSHLPVPPHQCHLSVSISA